MRSFYLFNSRVLTHLSFWVIYYLTFSIIWAKGGNYFNSFFLEFILLPVRMLAVYVTLYVLIPRYLRNERYWSFGLGFLGMLFSAGVLQRLFIFFFYEGFVGESTTTLFDAALLLRAMILINSTVLFVSAIKITQLWHIERQKNEQLSERLSSDDPVISIKSDKRFFRIPASEILFIEGLGNYVIYHTADQKLISYTSLKDALDQLPNYFIRIHKSYVINKERIHSYDPESVEINQTMIPVGKSFKGELVI